MAWTGIAAILLKGGRTVHSRFRLPFNINSESTSSITADSSEAQQLREARLIVWDEITMANVHAFNLVDRLLRDVTDDQRPFGGKVVFVGGDFRQCLPVIPRGSRTLIVESCVVQATVWPAFKHFQLRRNMRALDGEQQFKDWLLQLGNGELRAAQNTNLTENLILIPDEFVVRDVVAAIYGDVNTNTGNDAQSKIILCPRNDECDQINEKIIENLTGTSKSYLSADSIDATDQRERDNFPIEFLHSLTPSGMPPHSLTLKVGAPIMLLRNLAISDGLCNGTRLTVVGLSDNLIHAEISMGQFKGTRTFIPRMDLTSGETSLPFTLKRRQFPLKVCYAMTINKSQGQSFDMVGIYLRQLVFAHGQLYVAFSRGKSWSSVKVQIGENESCKDLCTRNCTKNIVYASLLQLIRRNQSVN